MNKRTKLVLGIILGVLVLAFGTTFVLARTGVIKLGILAENSFDADLEVIIKNPDGTQFKGLADIEVSGTFQTYFKSASDDKNGTTSALFTGLETKTPHYIKVTSTGCTTKDDAKTTGDSNSKVTSQIILTCSGTTTNPGKNTFNLYGRFVDKATGEALPNGIGIVSSENPFYGHDPLDDEPPAGTGVDFIPLSSTSSPQSGLGNSTPSGNDGIFRIKDIQYSQDSATGLEELKSLRIKFSVSNYYHEKPPPPDGFLLSSFVNVANIQPGQTYFLGTIKMAKDTVATPDTFSVSGKVVSGSTALRGAIVSIIHSDFGNKSFDGIADANGNYSITGIPFLSSNGSGYTVLATAGGYGQYKKSIALTGKSTVDKNANNKLSDINLTATAGQYSIVGTVKDGAGLVSGATISTNYSGATIKSSSQLIAGPIPGEYNYQLTVALPAGTTNKAIEVKITPPATHKSTSVTKTVTASSNTNFGRADFQLERVSATINKMIGYVVSSDGELIPGVQVSAKGTSFNSSAVTSTGKSVREEEDECTKRGYFCLWSAPKEKITLTFSGLTSGYMIEGGNTQTVDLTSAGDNFTKFFRMIPDPSQTDKQVANIYGSILLNNQRSVFIPGLTVAINIDGDIIRSEASKSEKITTDGITAEHNYLLKVPVSKLSNGKSYPIELELDDSSAYKLVGSTGSQIQYFSSVANYSQFYYLEKAEVPVQQVQIAGLVVDSKSKKPFDLGQVKIKIISINTDKLSPKQLDTSTEKINYSSNLLQGQKINFLSNVLPRSLDDKYLISFSKSGYKTRVYAVDGYKPDASNYIMLGQVELVGNSFWQTITDPIVKAFYAVVGIFENLWGKVGGGGSSEYDNVMGAFNKAEKLGSSAPVSDVLDGYDKLSGTPFGLGTPYRNNQKSTFSAAWDGQTGTFFDTQTRGAYTGLKLSSPSIVGLIRVYPREGKTAGFINRKPYSERMKGGKFQGANAENGPWTDLFTITSAPTSGEWTIYSLDNNTTTYKYIRYLPPSGGSGNVAEIELWSRRGGVLGPAL